MTIVGGAFRAPRINDGREWEKVCDLIAKGVRFHEGEVHDSSPTKPAGHPDPKPKGIVSVFQMKARKRKRNAQQPAGVVGTTAAQP